MALSINESNTTSISSWKLQIPHSCPELFFDFHNIFLFYKEIRAPILAIFLGNTSTVMCFSCSDKAICKDEADGGDVITVSQ